MSAESTLWEQLGGETKLRLAVSLFTDKVTQNPRVNYFRDGKYSASREALAGAEKSAFELISGATGGPYQYEGRQLRDIHKDMRISLDEFDAFMGDFEWALKEVGSPAAAIGIALQLVSALKPLIVDPSLSASPPPADIARAMPERSA